MSNVKKTVKIKENDLVDLIDNIVNEAVKEKKKQWLAEQAKKTSDKTAMLENRLADLEGKLSKLLTGK